MVTETEHLGVLSGTALFVQAGIAAITELRRKRDPSHSRLASGADRIAGGFHAAVCESSRLLQIANSVRLAPAFLAPAPVLTSDATLSPGALTYREFAARLLAAGVDVTPLRLYFSAARTHEDLSHTEAALQPAAAPPVAAGVEA